jgi:hypothetical protein
MKIHVHKIEPDPGRFKRLADAIRKRNGFNNEKDLLRYSIIQAKMNVGHRN